MLQDHHACVSMKSKLHAGRFSSVSTLKPSIICVDMACNIEIGGEIVKKKNGEEINMGSALIQLNSRFFNLSGKKM